MASEIQSSVSSGKSLFQDTESWREFEESAVAKIFEDIKPGKNIRVWIPSCGTGEDAYSAAILLSETAQTHPTQGLRFQVLATDSDLNSIQIARKGTFPKTINQVMSSERIDQCFIDEVEFYRIKPEISVNLRFSRQNFLLDPPFMDLDLIIFRDALRKMKSEDQKAAVSILAFSLKPDGFLFISKTEKLPENAGFKNFAGKTSIYTVDPGAEKQFSFSGIISLRAKEGVSEKIIEGLEGEVKSKEEEILLIREENKILRDDVLLAQEKSLFFWEIFQQLKNQKGEGNGEEVNSLRENLERRNLQIAEYEKKISELESKNHELASRKIEPEQKKLVELDPGQKQKLEKLISEFTSAILATRPEQLEAGIQKILKDIGTSLKAERGYVFQFHPFDLLMDCTLEWCAEGISYEANLLKRLSPNKILWSINKLKKFENVVVHKIMGLPPEAALDRSEFGKRQVKSYFLVPMICDGGLVGFTGFETINNEVDWTEEGVRLLRIVAPFIAGALLRRKAEYSLQSTEKLFKQVIEFLPDQFFIKNQKGETLFANKTYFDSARSRDDYDEKRGGFNLLPWKAQPFFDFKAGTGEIPKSSPPKQLPEKVITDALGKKKVFQTSVTPVSVGGIEGLCLMGINSEITALRGFEEKAKKLEEILKTKGIAPDTKSTGVVAKSKEGEAARESQESQFELFEKVGREIRTPIDGIHGLVDLLQKSQLTKEQSEHLESIKSNVTNAMMYLRNLLDFSKIISGKIEFEKANIDFRTMIEEVNDLLAIKAFEKDVEFISLIEKDVPIKIKSDASSVKQILINLIHNAIKFTSKGEIRLEVSMDQMDPTKKSLRFEVIDTGSGMDTMTLEKVFSNTPWDPEKSSEGITDSGLGLLISRRLVDLFGGKLSVESQQGVGTTVWFTLPFDRAAGESADLSKKARHFKEKKIIIVDHNEKRGLSVKAALEMWKCKAEFAPNAFSAMQKMREAVGNADPFQMVMIESTLTVVGVDALARKIKDDALLKDFPESILVKMVSPNITENLENLEKVGFSAFLKKPVKMSLFFDTLSAIFSLKQRNGTVDLRSVISMVSEKSFSRKLKILLAEHDTTQQTVIKSLLKDYEYKIDVVPNGQDVILLLSKNEYDVVLMESDMPKMDGYTAAKTIRDSGSAVKNHEVTLLCMAMDDTPETKKKVAESGMNGFIVKPVDTKKLMDSIEDSFSKTKAAQVIKEITAKTGTHEAVKMPTLESSVPYPSPQQPSHLSPQAPVQAPTQPQAQVQTASAPVIVLFNREALLKRLGGDENSLKEIIKMFQKISGIQINVLREAVRKKDPKMAEKTASIIHGASNNAEAVSIKEYSGQIEKAVKEGDFVAAGILVEKLQEEFVKFKELEIV
ncbi:MAG: response regulator [Candidatus Riflebacteria bacterium]|nr:response regulator [Candidatus Riflebacteria bacterium]